MFISTSSISLSELSKIPLLSSLTDLQLRRVRKSTRVTTLPKGSRLFTQGQTANRFFFVRSGLIKQFSVSFDGNERVVDIIQPKQIIAESLLFVDQPVYPFSAEALINTDLLTFDSESFINVLGTSIDTCFRLMSTMSMDIQHYIEQVDYLTMQNAGNRLVNFLLKQIPGSHQDKHSYTIYLEAPKCVIASWLSIQPETLSRQLGTLKAQELIQVEGNAITINDICQLRQMVV